MAYVSKATGGRKRTGWLCTLAVALLPACATGGPVVAPAPPAPTPTISLSKRCAWAPPALFDSTLVIAGSCPVTLPTGPTWRHTFRFIHARTGRTWGRASLKPAAPGTPTDCRLPGGFVTGVDPLYVTLCEVAAVSIKLRRVELMVRAEHARIVGVAQLGETALVLERTADSEPARLLWTAVDFGRGELLGRASVPDAVVAALAVRRDETGLRAEVVEKDGDLHQRLTAALRDPVGRAVAVEDVLTVRRRGTSPPRPAVKAPSIAHCSVVEAGDSVLMSTSRLLAEGMCTPARQGVLQWRARLGPRGLQLQGLPPPALEVSEGSFRVSLAGFYRSSTWRSRGFTCCMGCRRQPSFRYELSRGVGPLP